MPAVGLADPHPLAHRGLCQHAPENTLPAYAAAIDLGLDLEIDVYQTVDNHLVLIHDQTVDRTTNGTGKVVEKTLIELRALDAGSWFSPAYSGAKIPTFDELLRLVKANQWRSTVIAINMKTISPGIERRIVERLRHPGMTAQCFIFAAPDDSAKRFKAADPDLAVATSARNAAEFSKAVAREDYDAIWYYAKPSREQIEAAHAAGKRVWLSGSCIKNDPDCWANARTTGADGICANHPLEARERWRQMARPGAKRGAPAFPVEAPKVPLEGPDTRSPASTPIIVTHRGLLKYAPENTLPAFAAATSLGLGIELDVYQTKDNQLVVIHDATVNRTTNGKGQVTSMTFDELRRLDAGSWFDPAFAGMKIPTFEEALKIVRARQWCPTLIAINMKAISPGIEERITRLVEKYELLGQVFAFAMDAESARRFRAANPKLPLAVYSKTREGWSDSIRTEGYSAVWTSGLLKKEHVTAAHEAGRKVHLFDPHIQHNPSAWKHALRIGADSMCTDHPLEARKRWFAPLEAMQSN